jgi:hypothetical protein
VKGGDMWWKSKKQKQDFERRFPGIGDYVLKKKGGAMKDIGLVFRDEVVPFNREMFDALTKRIKACPAKGYLIMTNLNEKHFTQELNEVWDIPQHTRLAGCVVSDKDMFKDQIRGIPEPGVALDDAWTDPVQRKHTWRKREDKIKDQF